MRRVDLALAVLSRRSCLRHDPLIGLCQHRVAHALTGYWTKTFTDTRLCTAIVDRLTFNGDIIETGTTSYRLAHTRARQATS
ncbi:MAG TPA: ATP-binding protein [Pseudonocardiaceae bacterium]|nr:ATP-binding protein [Pseudonocardiaceae bacterium]